MAVRIRLKRMGKIREAVYRVVVVDQKKKRDGRVIEEIGFYNPNEDPSVIDINSERARYWLSVGAQPSEAVLAQLKITGDWQAAKGLQSNSKLRTKAVVDRDKEREEAVAAVQADAEKRRAEKAQARQEAEEKAAAEAAASQEAESSENPESPESEEA